MTEQPDRTITVFGPLGDNPQLVYNYHGQIISERNEATGTLVIRNRDGSLLGVFTHPQYFKVVEEIHWQDFVNKTGRPAAGFWPEERED